MGDFVLSRHAGVEHGRVIAAQGQRHPCLDQPRQGVIGKPGHRAGALVRYGADFQRDVAALQLIHQHGVQGGANAVADALRTQLQGVVHVLRAADFAGVHTDPQAHVVRALEHL